MGFITGLEAQRALECRGTRAVISLGAIRRNVGLAMKKTGPERKLMAVVKADGYGHGAVMTARAALEAGAEWLGVASPMEGKELREAGIAAPILVLAPLFPDSAPTVIDYHLVQAVDNLELCRALDREARDAKTTVRVHVKFDTGMGRMGIRAPDSAAAFFKELDNLPHIKVEGVFSHLACADSSDKTHPNAQLSAWSGILKELSAAGFNPGIRHIANSAAVLSMPEAYYDMARFGISLYGLQPSNEVADPGLEPAMAFLTRIAEIKEIGAGNPVSYCCTFVTSRPSRIAVLPVGYADGYLRHFSNRGRVIVRGARVPVVGRVCMDLTMVDVTDVPDAEPGDDVLLFGKHETDCLPAEEAAGWIGTINYELVCAVSKRVPRVYVDE